MNYLQGRRVVITGVGTINPLGGHSEEFWHSLIIGKQGVCMIKNFDIADYHVRIGAEADLPDLIPYFRKMKTTRKLDRFAVFSHIAASQAHQDAGIDTGKNPTRYGAIIACSAGGIISHMNNMIPMNEKGLKVASPFYVVMGNSCTGSALMGMEFNLQGPNFTVNSACASSAHAIGISAMLIKTGMADAIFTGGAEAPLSRIGLAGFGNIGALSKRNDDPETASRPFDKDRDGFVVGEGATVICLEELEHAKKRGARIYGEISGFGISCDAYDLVKPHSEGRGARIAMTNAINAACLNREQIDLINAHATSTPFGDLFESIAINAVFEDLAETIPVHSTKSLTGHLIGAAGATEVLAALLAINRNIIHKSHNIFKRDPKIKLNLVSEDNLEKKVYHVLSNSFGFGGQNASLIISRFMD